MNKNQIRFWLKTATIAANFIFVLWILRNGINEGFQGTFIEKVSYISLMCLLSLNSILLLTDSYQRKSEN
jgi:hypothetical protein